MLGGESPGYALPPFQGGGGARPRAEGPPYHSQGVQSLFHIMFRQQARQNREAVDRPWVTECALGSESPKKGPLRPTLVGLGFVVRPSTGRVCAGSGLRTTGTIPVSP